MKYIFYKNKIFYDNYVKFDLYYYINTRVDEKYKFM